MMPESSQRQAISYHLGQIEHSDQQVAAMVVAEQLTRAAAIRRLKGSPVPAWMFIDPQGNIDTSTTIGKDAEMEALVKAVRAILR